MLAPAALNYSMDFKTCSETRTTSLSYTTGISFKRIQEVQSNTWPFNKEEKMVKLKTCKELSLMRKLQCVHGMVKWCALGSLWSCS